MCTVERKSALEQKQRCKGEQKENKMGLWLSGEARGKAVRGFFMGCERALLADKKKNTLCIISLSLGSDKPRPMQREK